MDTDNDGYLSFDEVFAMYNPPSEKGMVLYNAPPGKITQEVAPTVTDSMVDTSDIDKDTLCSIGRGQGCNIEMAINRGFFETGLGPLFPKGADCFAIDDGFALDYSFKRGGRRAYHGGIDIPTPYGVPMLAIADGTVVSIYQGANSKRGKEINLRHSPDDTGLPIWIYSQYAHFDQMPDFKVGQRVRMGEILGPTGNSGLGRSGRQSKKRRPAIHFAMWYSKSPKFAEDNDKIIPVDGYWIDPIAIYRQSMPVASAAMKALPDEEKLVSIPVIYSDGTTNPEKTRLIWPYACVKEK